MLIPAYAKINLYLKVMGKQENGYHNLKMLMQSISLHDDIYIQKNNSGKIRVDIINENNLSENERIYLADKDNLVYKAAELLLNQYKPNVGVDIALNKRIPMQAGLGGGSSDAASVLLGLNRYLDLKLSVNELSLLGLKLGADIPFCLRGGLALVEGIGEQVTPLPKIKMKYVLIVKPHIGISTKEAFAHYDRCLDEKSKNDTFENLIKALEKEELKYILPNMFNDLEVAVFNMAPEIAKIKMELEKPAGGALMTGSGSAVFTLFDDYYKALECFERIKKFENMAQMFFTNTV